ncbi:MAG TPA: hypothetical protein PLT74_05735 [Kiritimatiellia bacterium]|nr:hypothetical protein [Kiritimatiellia bacterium]
MSAACVSGCRLAAAWRVVAIVSLLLAPGAARPETDMAVWRLSGASGAMALDPMRSYAVLASEATVARPEWRRVVEILRAKYEADVVLYPAGHPEQALPGLRRLFPNYACFVEPPETCGRGFVLTLHRLTRRLDDDPYGDLLWGILTGYAADDAARIAALREPLIIRRGATSMGPDLLQRLDVGFATNENAPSDFWQKPAGAAGVAHRAVAPDAARALAQAFREIPVDVFYTSGHATERDWQIAYNLPGGAVVHEHGTLCAVSADNTRHPFASPNPKVYLPVGNCLIGHIDTRDCMATAWLHSGGVVQMIGYTAVTFYGYMGWGTGLLFEDGRLTLSEAFFLNNQSLLHQLARRFPHALQAQPGTEDYRSVDAFRQRHAVRARDELGLLWDRDAVAFYGDPAWAARYPVEDSAADVVLTRQGERWTLTATVRRDGVWEDPKWGGRPLAVLLPFRLRDIANVTCVPAGEALVTDRFALLPVAGRRKAGDHYTLTFTAW